MRLIAVYHIAQARQRTGAHKRFYRLVEYLAERHEVILLCPGIFDELQKKVQFVQTRSLATPFKVIPASLAFRLGARSSLRELRRRSKLSEFDLVYTFGESNAPLSSAIARMADIPFVLVSRADKISYFSKRMSSKGPEGLAKRAARALRSHLRFRIYVLALGQIYRRSARIVVQSRAHRDSILRKFRNVDGEAVDVVPNDLPTERVCTGADRMPRENVQLIFVGSLIPRKGVHILLDALGMLAESKRNWTLRICGEGPELEKLHERTGALGLGNRVRFEGFVRNVKRQIADSDLLILPSFADEFPNVLLEAMALGVPAIGSSVGAVPDILGSDAVFPPGDSELLAEELDRLMEAPCRSALRAKQAERSTRFRFDWNRAMEATICEVLSRESGSD